MAPVTATGSDSGAAPTGGTAVREATPAVADGSLQWTGRLWRSSRRTLGRMSGFAVVGAFGAVLNLAIMAVLVNLGAHYLVAAVIATEFTILSNFLMHERLVFHDVRGGRPFLHRLFASLGFNNLEALARMPFLVILVDHLSMPSVTAQALTLAIAFLVRFGFTSKVIYRTRPASAPTAQPGHTGKERQS